MDERVMQFRVGVFALATLIVTAILLVMFGKLPALISHPTYDVLIDFHDADGVTKGTPVRKSGILIGRVADVQLNDKDATVRVVAKIDAGRSIYQNEVCFVSRNLLSGDTALVFVTVRGKPGAGKRIALDKPLEGHLSDDPTGLKTELQQPIDTVVDTGRALKEASEQLGAAAKKVEELLDSERGRIHDVLDNAAESLGALRNVLGDRETQQRLAEALKKMPDTLDSMNQTFRSADNSLRTFSRRSGPDQKTPVERMVDTVEMTERMLRKFNESSDLNKPPPADQIADAMENINEITGLMRSIMARIDRGDGSLGALLNDRQLYNRLNRAAGNIEQVSRELKPIADNVWQLTDKVNRHPGAVIRDAVKPGAGIK